MKKYTEPRFVLRSFAEEYVRTEEINSSVADTYENWVAKQQVKATIEKRFTMINEITKFNF